MCDIDCMPTQLHHYIFLDTYLLAYTSSLTAFSCKLETINNRIHFFYSSFILPHSTKASNISFQHIYPFPSSKNPFHLLTPKPSLMAAKSSFTILYSLMLFLLATTVMANFNRDFDTTWGADHAHIMENGRQMQLSLDKSSGAAFQSKKEHLHGRFDMRMKFVGGNSAGTVTTFYLSSTGPNHDEIDFEFLGNLSGDPYTVHTNVYSQGKGDREEQFHLWFDPTKAFHTYSIIWTPKHIIWMVDESPIRMYKKTEAIPYPSTQKMRVYASLWNADDWATRGGLVKTDWTKAPFVASYRMFRLTPCISVLSSSPCSVSTPEKWWNQIEQKPSTSSRGSNMAGNGAVNGAVERLKWVQNNYRIYGYCSDLKRFPQGLPKDCSQAL